MSKESIITNEPLYSYQRSLSLFLFRTTLEVVSFAYSKLGPCMKTIKPLH